MLSIHGTKPISFHKFEQFITDYLMAIDQCVATSRGLLKNIEEKDIYIKYDTHNRNNYTHKDIHRAKNNTLQSLLFTSMIHTFFFLSFVYYIYLMI